MNTIIPTSADNVLDVHKSQMEQVEQEKQQFSFIGTYIRRLSLNLYAYDAEKQQLYQLHSKKTKDAHTEIKGGKLVLVKRAEEECIIHSEHIVFESLNKETARNRVAKYEQGLIQDLCNLRKPNPNPLKLKLW